MSLEDIKAEDVLAIIRILNSDRQIDIVRSRALIIGENRMTEIKTICPVCEKDITIADRDITLAVSHKEDTGGNVLVTCSECCRALVVPVEGDPAEWIAEASQDDDWNGCVPMLDDTEIKKPSGSRGDLGVLEYIPGDGGPAMRKRPYMWKYGINPECHMAKNPSMGKKPKVLG